MGEIAIQNWISARTALSILTVVLLIAARPVAAQDVSEPPTENIVTEENEASSGPGGIDPSVTAEFSIEELLGNLPEEAITALGEVPPPEAAAPDRYLYTTLRVVNRSSTRGCGYGDWNCMTKLCKADLGSAAWRGWAGCHKSGSSWICYFECGLVRNAF